MNRKMFRKITVVILFVTLAVCAGCEPHSERKKAVHLRWKQSSTQVKLPLARQHFDNGRFKEAEKIVSDSLNFDPNIPEAHLLLGEIMLENGDVQRGVFALETAVRLDERLHRGWYLLGVSASNDGLLTEAAEYHALASKQMPRNAEYVFALVRVYVEQGQIDKAIGILEHKLSQIPQDVSLKVAAAGLMIELGNRDRAIELYRQALLISGDDPKIIESLAYSYFLSERWSEAARMFERMVKVCPEGRQGLYMRLMATCNMNAGQYHEAASCYNKLSVQERGNAEIWLKMGHAALGAGLAERAFSYSQKALSLKPGWADAIVLQGCALYLKGDYKTAIKTFSRVKSDKANSDLAYVMIGRCYEKLGYSSKAKRAYKNAKEINPSNKLLASMAEEKD